ncbi:hypothetical protein [Marinococcus halophilus]|uniref:hypothetical protein n=1 Tax=Marinococcus halophilus TaxID=1371 RepID=UPI0009A5AE03|nr:hypothetical protein [Marinococcus halophilus]
MCVLCGEFIEQVHWTDIERKKLDTIVAGESQRERKRSRLLRTEICNDVLEFYGLTISEWNNSKFLLKSRTGKMAVIHDLGQIWFYAEKMAGMSIDPLNEHLINNLNKG